MKKNMTNNNIFPLTYPRRKETKGIFFSSICSQLRFNSYLKKDDFFLFPSYFASFDRQRTATYLINTEKTIDQMNSK